MEERESIKNFVQIFILITNQLILLGKTFDNVNLVHKVLRSLIEEWQPKVIDIKESLKIGMAIIQELYGNLKELELELKRYKRMEKIKGRNLWHWRLPGHLMNKKKSLMIMSQKKMKMKWPS